MNDVKRIYWISICLISLVSGLAWGHDTVVVHPRITEEAIKAIQAEDTAKAYFELYLKKEGTVGADEYERVNWGKDPALEEIPSLNSPKKPPAFSGFRKHRLNVLDGVVMEDDPSSSIVLRHFYHAYTGNPLTLDFLTNLSPYGEHVTSKVAAIRFFDQAVETFGYESDSIKPFVPNGNDTHPSNSFSFWLFGHALHHLEDMNSIAHVSNDAHITTEEIDQNAPVSRFQERDDFEANYLPTKVWGKDPDIVGYFENQTPHTVTSFEDIWPKPSSSGIELAGNSLKVNSLARSVYNLAVFQGSFELPMKSCTPPVIVPSPFPLPPLIVPPYCLDVPPPANPCGDGEIAQMFNDPSLPTCRVHWNEMGVNDYPQWTIDGVGDYEYQGFIGFDSHWWDGSHFGGPAGYYYIEQLMDGIGRGTCEGIDENGNFVQLDGCEPFNDANMVVPYKARQNFGQVYDSGSNPVTANTEPLAKLIAQQVIPLGPRYAAGFAKWWFQIVNTPPYLKKVEIVQDGKIRYTGEWKDKVATRSLTMINERKVPVKAWMPGWTEDVLMKMSYVRVRDLEVDLHAEPSPYLSTDKDLEITLDFNEPIRLPIDIDSGFELGLGTKMFDMKTIKAIENLSDQKKKEPSDELSPLQRNTLWKFTIAASELADLNGKIPLVVKAKDTNMHWIGPDRPLVDGLGLDEDPGTPARRKRRNAGLARANFSENTGMSTWLTYEWHDTTSIDVNYVDQAATEEDKMKHGNFSYDRSGEGDQTHILIFDNEKPASVNLEGSVQDPPDA